MVYLNTVRPEYFNQIVMMIIFHSPVFSSGRRYDRCPGLLLPGKLLCYKWSSSWRIFKSDIDLAVVKIVSLALTINSYSFGLSFAPSRWPVNQEVSWLPLWPTEGSVQSQASVSWVQRQSEILWVSCTRVACMTFLVRWPFMWVTPGSVCRLSPPLWHNRNNVH